jgi:hypothetical protein
MGLWGWVIVIGAQIILGWLSKKLNPQKRRHDVTLSDPNERLPVVYGETRVWSNRVFIAATDGNKVLWQVCAYSHGECEGITGVYLDGQTAWLADHASNGFNGWLRSSVPIRYVERVNATTAILYCGVQFGVNATDVSHSWITGDKVVIRGTGRAALDNKVFSITYETATKIRVTTTSDPGTSGDISPSSAATLKGNENGADWAGAYAKESAGYFTQYYGTDSQTADATLVAAFVAGATLSRWTSDHRGRGVAYGVLKFHWDEKAFLRGIPSVEFRAKGRKVWDLVSTTAWSDNPAHILYDYLTNTRYGLGLPASRVDLATFQAAATYCAESVTVPTGTQARYRCNGVVDANRTVRENLEDLLTACRGNLLYQQGTYFLFITKGGQTANPDYAVTEDRVLGGFRVLLPGTEDLANTMTVRWVNPGAGYTEEQFEWPDGALASNVYYVQDGALKLPEQLDLPFVTNVYQAQHQASIRRHEQRAGIRIETEVDEGATILTVGDVVNVTHSGPGFTAKPFWVMGMEHDPIARRVKLALLEYEEAAYPTAGLGAPDVNVNVDLDKDTDVPASDEIQGPTSLLLASNSYPPRIQVTWSGSRGPVAGWDVQWRASTETTWRNAGRLPAEARELGIGPVADGVLYYVQVRAVSALGNVAQWITASIVADVEPVANPTFLTPIATSVAITYGVTFDAYTKEVRVYSRQHSASGQGNPAEIPDYLVGILTPANSSLEVPTRASWYRRTILVAYNENTNRGADSGVIETQASGGTGPTGTPALALDVKTSTTVRVDLTAGDGTATSYRLYKNGVAVADIAHSAVEYTYLGLQPNTAYNFTVREIKNGTLGTESSVVTVTTDPITLDTPTGLTAFGGSDDPATPALTVQWTIGANAGAAQHEVWVAPDVSGAPGTYALAETVGAGVSSRSYTGQPQGTIEWFKVRAVQSGYTTSGYSNEDPGSYQVEWEPS